MATIGKIGKYERLDVLGHGTSGVVYLAWDTLLRRNVALKEIRAAGPEMEKVLDEARVLDRLGRHPHIVQVHSVDSIGGTVLIDMELVRGGNLSDLLRERTAKEPLPAAEAVRIARAVLDALAYAHERRIIHRDIKPANILIGADGLVKLTDFGLAEALGSGSVAGGGGTYPYMAPEDFADADASDYRSDLWAVGVMLYEMLTGRRPFQVPARTRDPFAWKRAIAEDVPPRPTELCHDLPAAADTILQRALAKSKDDRYPTARAFADALGALAGELPACAPISAPQHQPDGSGLEAGARPSDAPEKTFLFANGAIATDLDGLLAQSARHWDEARDALIDGRTERFLREIGEVYIADLAADLRGRGGDADRRLSEFLSRSQAFDEAAVEQHPSSTPTVNGRLPTLLFRNPPITRDIIAEPVDDRTIAGRPIQPEFRAPAAPMPTPAGDAVAAKRPSRWWFFPLYMVCIGPLLAAMSAAGGPAQTSGRESVQILLGWGATGFLSAMLLVIGQEARVWAFARVVCGVTLAAGLVAAGALVARMLSPQPTSNALMSVSVVLMVPIAIMLLVAASAPRLYRFWAWMALLIALGLTVELSRPGLPRVVQFSHSMGGSRI